MRTTPTTKKAKAHKHTAKEERGYVALTPRQRVEANSKKLAADPKVWEFAKKNALRMFGREQF